MKFSAFSQGEKFAFPGEIEIEIDEGDSNGKNSAAGKGENEGAFAVLFSQIKELLASRKNEAARDETKEQKTGLSVETVSDAERLARLDQSNAAAQAIVAGLETLAAQTKKDNEQIAALAAELTALKTALAAQESGVSRPAATGAGGGAETDC
jgi:hypothetical protein